MTIKFSGSLKYYISSKQIEVEFKNNLEDLCAEISKKIGKKLKCLLDFENKKSFIILDDNGTKVRFSAIFLNNGENLLTKKSLEDGELLIILPVGGG
ncbi:MAG: MoaD/ThiS family protein [Thermosipho sp. (in: Bacteria)]|nr:MoaD/ThiS family protein [Thermosipho sp. (in: thermotogales)]